MSTSVTSPPIAINRSPTTGKGRDSGHESLPSKRGSPLAKGNTASPSGTDAAHKPAAMLTTGQDAKQTVKSSDQNALAKLLKGHFVPHPPSVPHPAGSPHAKSLNAASSNEGQATSVSQEPEAGHNSRKGRLASILRRVAMAVRFKQKRYNPNERSASTC